MLETDDKYLKSAECDSRKRFSDVPLVSASDVRRCPEPVHRVLESEDVLEQEQLADGIGEVGKFDEQIADGQVVSMSLASDQQTMACDQLAIPSTAVVSTVALSHQIAVYLCRDDRQQRLQQIAEKYTLYSRLSEEIRKTTHSVS